MPKPITVWMVPLRRGVPPRDVQGTLTMEDDGLAFEADKTGETVLIPFADARKVRRVRGSPILMVEWTYQEQALRAAFYFAPPPPLGPMDRNGVSVTSSNPLSGLKRPSKRRTRRENATYLTSVGGDLKPLIATWSDEANAKMTAGREPGADG
ncbi:MAG: hypothetical protein ACXVWF_04165 [Actinomycetota bacterium]